MTEKITYICDSTQCRKDMAELPPNLELQQNHGAIVLNVSAGLVIARDSGPHLCPECRIAVCRVLHQMVQRLEAAGHPLGDRSPADKIADGLRASSGR